MAAGVDTRVGGVSVGTDEGVTDLSERRIEGRFSVQPTADVEVGIGMPVLFRTLQTSSAQWDDIVPGDLEVWTTGVVHRSGTSLRHDVTVTGQLKFPTAPVTYNTSGDALASNLQPGCSSIVPGVSGSYALAWSLVSLSFSGGLLLPIVVREAPHRGAMIRQTTTLRVRPVPALAFAAGFTWLGELIGQDETDANEEDSGGLVGYASAAIEAGKPGLLVASVGLDAPAVKALRGEQSPTVIGMARLSVGWDI